MLSTCYVSIDSAKCSKIRTVHVQVTSNELSVKKSGKFFICMSRCVMFYWSN